MDIRCKPLYATFTAAATLESTNEDLYGLLEMIDQDDGILECMSECRVVEPEVRFDMDHEDMTIKEPQYGYVVVMQRCLHKGKTIMSADLAVPDKTEEVEGSDKEEDEIVVPQKPFLVNRDCLEALFLRKRDKVGERYEKVGLIWFDGSRAVGKVLRAHHIAEIKVITII